tara:strand:+ start:991 stop:1221 length:231 start_codon:yes stop_codon:yes gene_type:complete
MRTETYNALRQHFTDNIAWHNTRLSTWNSDPVGVGTTITAEYSHYTNETVEFLKQTIHGIHINIDVLAKLDELHGV